MRKIVETVGYHSGAVVMKQMDTTDGKAEIIAEEEPAYGGPLELQPTRDYAIFLVIPYRKWRSESNFGLPDASFYPFLP